MDNTQGWQALTAFLDEREQKRIVQQQEFHRKWARLWADIKRRCTTAQTRNAVQREIEHHAQRLGELIWLERRAGESGWLDAVS